MPVKKIIFAIKTMDDARGGAERVLADVTGGLVARGHDVAVLTFDGTGQETFYALDPRVRQLRLGIGNVSRKATFPETLIRMAAIRRKIREESPYAVVAFMHSMFVPLSLSLIGTGVPVIASEHIVPDHYKTRRFEFSLLLMSSFLIKKITVLSASIMATYPTFLRPKMVVMPNPVKPAEASADPVAQSKNPKTILNVGRLDLQKDQETLIRAFAAIRQDYPGWQVQIVGDGVLKDKLTQIIKETGTEDGISLLPSTKDIGRLYRDAQIFALPSLYESFGLATAEAMAHGVPPIGFIDCPGTSELIADGQTGILVGGTDRVNAFAEGLRRLMDSSSLRLELGQNAKNYVGRFSLEPVIDRWEAALSDL